MNFAILLLMAVFFGALPMAPSHAQDLKAGEKIYKKVCKACHGPTAKGMASFPKLTGQSVEYLADRLTDYKSGKKVGPNTPLMAPRAANLSDDDIVNVSNFIVAKFNKK